MHGHATCPQACLLCGVVLDRSGRDYCDDCLPERRAEQASGWAISGLATLAKERASGNDPAHGGEAGRKRGGRNAAHVAAVVDWDRQNGKPVDLDWFARDVLPRIQGVPLRLMAEATGLSEGYCSFVRRGLKVPHQRHWSLLARLHDELSEATV